MSTPSLQKLSLDGSPSSRSTSLPFPAQYPDDVVPEHEPPFEVIYVPEHTGSDACEHDPQEPESHE